MDLIKCPRCGEEYSPSYRKCPFCEEGDHPRKIGKHNTGSGKTGRRVSDKKQTHSARGAMAAVLVVALLLLSWSLFGDKIVAKLGPSADDSNPGVQDDANKPGDGTADNTNEGGDSADPNAGDVPDPNGPDGETGDPNAQTPADNTTPTTPTTPTVDASALSVKTNVGTTLPKDVNGNFDCTIKASESIRLSVSGTDAAAAWAVADASILSVSADGTISPIKAGITTVTATVGGAVLNITVRIK